MNIKELAILHSIDPSELEAFIEASYLPQDIIEAGLSLGIDISDIEDAYCGKFNSDGEFAQDLHEQLVCDPVDRWPYNCIDWTRAANELMFDYCVESDHYFRNF